MGNGQKSDSNSKSDLENKLAQRMAAHYAITRLLADARTLSEVAPEILRAIIETLQWEMGILWSFDERA